MPSLPLFHICPTAPTGPVLYPLSEPKLTLPEVAARARRKYVGREWLPNSLIPTLSCRWMDVVFFVPVHPEEVRDALVATGHLRFPRHWIEIDAEQLISNKTAIFLPGESPADDAFVPFSSETLRIHSQLSAAQRVAYAGGEPGQVLLFGHTAHVLHRGSVTIDKSRVISL